MQPEEVLREECLPEYTSRRDAVWRRLIELRTSLVILRRLLDFPLDLVVGEGSVFWGAVKESLLEACVLRMWHLTGDSGSEQLASIRRFKNFVVGDAIRDEYRPELQEQLRETRFSGLVDRTLAKVNDLRNEVIAHFDAGLSEADLRQMQFSSLAEVERAWEELEALFQLLCFGFEHATLPAPYLGKVGGQPIETDIDKLLMSIASNAEVLRMPDEHPEAWRALRDGIAPGDLEQINEWRGRLRRPRA